MKRLAELLAIRSGEGRMASLVIGVMLVSAAGSALGSAGVETLFFTRFGVQYLPYMFMALGLVTMMTSLAIAVLIGRVTRERLYIALPFILALILLGARLALLSKFNWLYPALWLGEEVIITLIGFLVWGAAGVVCDARQSKRLFPLFNAGRILGSVLGGLSTGFLVSWFGTENLLIAWAVTLVFVFIFCLALLRKRISSPIQTRSSKRRQAGFVKEVQQGYQYARRSQLMRWISIAAILFSILYFSIALPFSRAATEQFPNEAQLAGFLGTFQGLSTAAAFIASLFFANRLFARFGIMSMLLAFPMIYLLGFGGLAIYPVFMIIVAFRFLQMLWLSGIADPAYQAMFNVAPPERRDQVRTFIGGVPAQAGTFIAGLVLIVGEQMLAPRQLYAVGLTASAACAYVVWQARRAYNLALVDALRAGRPHVFFSEEQSFGGFRRDAAAMTALIAGTRSEDLVIRRVSTEILGELAAPESNEALINALYDSDSMVRIHAMRALARGRVESAADEIKARLTDTDLEVRVEAIECLPHLTASSSDLITVLAPFLHDPIPRVRARAAASILRAGPHPEARHLLRDLAAHGDDETRSGALAAMGEWDGADSFDLIAAQLREAPAVVRRAAARALRCVSAERALPLLMDALKDAEIKEAVAKEIGAIGAPALESALAALSNPLLESGALLALEYLPISNPKPIEDFARSAVARALHYNDLMRSLKDGSQRAELLAEALHEKVHQHGISALRAVGLLGEREALSLAIENLAGRAAAQRANALETLESIGEHARGMIRPLLSMWDETPESKRPASPRSSLSILLDDPDAWIRACAAFAASDHPELKTTLTLMTQTDADALVRQAAFVSTDGDQSMDTLPTLSLMERILFLRRVPLFANLSTAELKQVAAISDEMLFADNDEIASQGEMGDTMHIIVSGEIRVTTLKGDGTLSELARRKAGECVGEMAIISREPRMASLIAAGDVRTLCIDQKGFEGLLRERSEVCLAVMLVLCARIREMAR